MRRVVDAPAKAIEDKNARKRQFAERRAQIAYNVLTLIVRNQNRIITVLQVPVIDQCHHDLQPLDLACAFKWIIMPLPAAVAVDILRPGFKTDVLERTLAGNI